MLSSNCFKLGAGALAAALITTTASADILVSSFEDDLSSHVGLTWTSDQTTSFVSNGATDGASALQIVSPDNYSFVLSLDGPAITPDYATYDNLVIDVTTPATAEWRQLILVMQGDGLNYTQVGQDVPLGTTSEITFDLSDFSPNPTATWWQTVLVLQGGDSGAGNITTTIDNIRLTNVPEPASLAVLGLGALSLTRRRSR